MMLSQQMIKKWHDVVAQQMIKNGMMLSQQMIKKWQDVVTQMIEKWHDVVATND